MTNTQTPYDLDRAAKAGGFGDDMETGREVARRLHTTVKRHSGVADFSAKDFISATIHEVADLYEGDPTSSSMWLAATSNALREMLRDLVEQVREARATR